VFDDFEKRWAVGQIIAGPAARPRILRAGHEATATGEAAEHRALATPVVTLRRAIFFADDPSCGKRLADLERSPGSLFPEFCFERAPAMAEMATS
jgi:hypothetical protein